jgi:hypothetical protein
MRQPTRHINTAQILLAALNGLTPLQLHTGASIRQQILSATQRCRSTLLCATQEIEEYIKTHATYSHGSGQAPLQHSKDYLDALKIIELYEKNINLIVTANTKEWCKDYNALILRITATAQDITTFISAEMRAAQVKLVAAPPCHRTSAAYPNGLLPHVPLSRRPIAAIFLRGSTLLGDARTHPKPLSGRIANRI